jgi:SAM-dependent methyltransferase
VSDDRPEPRIEDFLDTPTKDLEAWHWLWRRDERFPVRTHRGPLGHVVALVKRLLAPLVTIPANERWDRQRVFNLVLLERLMEQQAALAHAHDRIDLLQGKVAHLEATMQDGLTDVMRHDDALFSRVDVELDRHARRVAELLAELRAALAVAGEGSAAAAGVVRTWSEEQGYVDLEARYRGTEAEIAERVSVWVPRLVGCGPVLDLGCGRGEVLEVLGAAGIDARGVDSSERMVAICRGKGFAAEVGDLFQVLRDVPAGSLGAVVSLHVVEHLPPAALVDLTSLAFRALRPGGRLILETPNALSLMVSGRSFWLDPTHQRPVHPEYLSHCCRLAGFAEVEQVMLRPYADAERLPELELSALPPEQHQLADRINRLRDRIDEVLFGFQDFGVVATRGG